MKQFLPYFLVCFVLVLVSALFGAEVFAILVVVSLATAVLVHELFKSDIGRLKFALVVVGTYGSISVLYGCVYYFLPQSYIEPPFQRSISGVLDAIYFSFVTITTLGYGDFQPAHFLAKALVISQLLVGILTLVVGINYVLGRTSVSHKDSQSARSE